MKFWFQILEINLENGEYKTLFNDVFSEENITNQKFYPIPKNSLETIKNRVRSNKDLFGRDITFSKIEFTKDHFPEYIINIQENLEIREIKISSLNVIDYSLEKSIKLKYSLHFYQNDNFFIDEISENNKIFRRSKRSL